VNFTPNKKMQKMNQKMSDLFVRLNVCNNKGLKLLNFSFFPLIFGVFLPFLRSLGFFNSKSTKFDRHKEISKAKLIQQPLNFSKIPCISLAFP
jgi:hypothetical protein